MRIIRGTGLKGLRAFLPKSKFRSLTIIRPLIELHKKDILKWLESKNISYCVDKSNFEDKFLRNRIRLKLMPQLCEINPSIAQNLYNLSINTALDYDFIYTFSRKEFEKLKRGETKREIKLDLEGLKKNHPAILNNIIRIAIEELKGDTRKLELRHLDEIKDLIENRPSGSVVHLPGLSVRKEEKRLIIQTLIL
ncbi:MAG: TilS substrate-binding domain-containing protein [Candidatus Omnitrophica bacterium]|nr:TilS substrate-binding domain-containing protein [Candidatus Omnitrophota bacterium]